MESPLHPAVCPCCRADFPARLSSDARRTHSLHCLAYSRFIIRGPGTYLCRRPARSMTEAGPGQAIHAFSEASPFAQRLFARGRGLCRGKPCACPRTTTRVARTKAEWLLRCVNKSVFVWYMPRSCRMPCTRTDVFVGGLAPDRRCTFSQGQALCTEAFCTCSLWVQAGAPGMCVSIPFPSRCCS